MAVTHSTPQFPESIDRHSFATWLSGLVDGEGSFCLHYAPPERKTNRHAYATFDLSMRADDLPMLNLVRSFWCCGSLYCVGARGQSRPMAVFRVSKIADLTSKITPHFLQYPLRSRKAKDFPIWREGVLLCASVAGRMRPRKNTGSGMAVVWTRSELIEFGCLSALLKKQREFNTPPVELPPRRPRIEPFLFDP